MSQITAVILGSGGAGPLLTLTGNTGGAVPPAGGNINVVGTGSITVTGNPGTNTLTISSSGGGGITSITGDSGGAQSGPAITLTGGSSGGTFAGAANTLTLAFTELNLPTTSDSTHGVININGVPVFHTFGTNNMFIGQQGAQAGNFTLSGTNNWVGGGLAGPAMTSAGQCTLLGWGAGNRLTSGSGSTFVGYVAGGTLLDGGMNTALGYIALSSGTLTSGTYNVGIGVLAGTNFSGSDSNNIIISHPGVSGQSNSLRIGAGTGTGTQQLNSAFICGINGITVTGVPVLVSASDQLGIAVSSERYKEDIEDMDDYSDDIHELRPVTFNYKQEPNAEHKSVGLIAEEVELQMPQLVVKDKEGLPMTVRYLDLIPMLLNEVQKLKKTIDDLESRLEDLE